MDPIKAIVCVLALFVKAAEGDKSCRAVLWTFLLVPIVFIVLIWFCFMLTTR